MSRCLVRAILGVIALPVLYGLVAMILALVPGSSKDITGEGSVTVGLFAGPIHYDFLLPLDQETRDSFAFTENAGVPVAHPNAQWLMVGWGARDFYTSVSQLSDMDLGPTVKAVIGDQSVLRVDVTGPIAGDPSVDWIVMTQAQYDALRLSILTSFDAPNAPQSVLRQWSPDTRSGFFAAKGGFHIFQTCNQWVGQKLRAAGLKFGTWTPIPWSVKLSAWRFGHLAGP